MVALPLRQCCTAQQRERNANTHATASLLRYVVTLVWRRRSPPHVEQYQCVNDDAALRPLIRPLIRSGNWRLTAAFSTAAMIAVRSASCAHRATAPVAQVPHTPQAAVSAVHADSSPPGHFGHVRACAAVLAAPASPRRHPLRCATRRVPTFFVVVPPSVCGSGWVRLENFWRKFWVAKPPDFCHFSGAEDFETGLTTSIPAKEPVLLPLGVAYHLGLPPKTVVNQRSYYPYYLCAYSRIEPPSYYIYIFIEIEVVR